MSCPAPKIPELVIEPKGTPRPQPRPRAVGGKGGQRMKVVSVIDENAKAWIAEVKRHARHAVTANDGPIFRKGEAIECSIEFRFPTDDKKRHGKPHTHKPDIDNLLKLVWDACMSVGVGGDDCQIAVLTGVRKIWAPRYQAGAKISLRGHSVEKNACSEGGSGDENVDMASEGEKVDEVETGDPRDWL